MNKSRDKSLSRSAINTAAHQVLSTSTILREISPEPLAKSNQGTLQQQIDILLKENYQKDQTITSLQRNYEGISKIHKEEKSKTYE